MYALVSIVAVIAILAAVFIFLRRNGVLPRSYSARPRTEIASPVATFDFGEFPCGHDRRGEPATVAVRGTVVAARHERLCAACLSAWLERYSTTCASCGGPILPGEPVGQAWVGARHPHTHLTTDCCETGGLYCGRWGQGRLVTLHELEPEAYPAGTPSVVAGIFAGGRSAPEDDK